MKPALTFAVAKGRLADPLIELLEQIGYDGRVLREESRRLIVHDEANAIRYLLAKPMDVPAFVEYGAADLGVVGKDVLLEQQKPVAELLDLKFEACSLIVAVKGDSPVRRVEELGFNSRVATKYPNVAGRTFNRLGIPVELIPMNGSIELAPLVGLADAIVDITATGTTLRENDLRIIATIAESSARLVANRVSLKVRHEEISGLTARLAAALGAAGAEVRG
ncbi:MAG TPA: ATP phosphoribosyltransferase [Limnochordia bacterium]|nr:ATP phosphoribosyltransferase [Limnochordia bacterium]